MTSIHFKKIESKNISVVIQGAIQRPATEDCIRSIRKFIPEAEIILSTWEGSDVSDLDFDILVMSQDPKATLHDVTHRVFNNYNRQLISTQGGVKKSTKEFILKLRSDIELTSVNFLDIINDYQVRNSKYAIFNQRVVISSVFTRNHFVDESGTYNDPILHISDWIFFGLSDDIKNYFLETEKVKEPEFSQYFTLENPAAVKRAYSTTSFRFPPEQQLAISFFKRYFPQLDEIKDYSYQNKELVDLSKLIILNNFIILDPPSCGFLLRKKEYLKITQCISNFSYVQFKTIYREHLFKKDYREILLNQKFLDKDIILSKHRRRIKVIIPYFFDRIDRLKEFYILSHHIRGIISLFNFPKKENIK